MTDRRERGEAPDLGDDASSGAARECLIEAVRLGEMVKVSAIDAESGLEVSVCGPAGAGLDALTRLAIRKLASRRARTAGR